MPTQAQPLVAVLSRSHSTSFFTSTVRVRTCNWSRTRRTASRIRCSSVLADEVTLAGSRKKAEEEIILKPITLKATVTICYKRLFNCLREGFDRVLDWSADHVHLNRLLLEIVSSELEPGQEKWRFSYASLCSSSSLFSNEATFEATFTVPASFVPVGAVLVVNEHREEIFIKSLVVAAATEHSAPLTFDCNSWVHPKSKSPAKRTFFPLKSYLPSQTPKGVESLRRSELAAIRGDGHGERKSFERIYDYDVYNDLGDPDHDADTKRPVLGGEDHPYPRRCRTGRPRSQTDPSSEVRHNDPLYVPYVPRDEAFSSTKWASFELDTLWSVLHELMTLERTFQHTSLSFPSFPAIDALFNLEKLSKEHGLEQLRNFITRIKKLEEYAFSFELPEIIKRDKFAWLKDEEFGRETLAGLNPLSIQLVTEFPFVSKLDEETYGSKVITKELIEDQIHGVMTAEEAVQSKKLFILDYHDMFLPYVNKVREQDGTTLYGSRTLFFLTDEGTLQPIAIELTRPKSSTKPQWRQVFTPPRDATGSWLWMLAKAHVLAHDTGYHQLVSHWLRTHCCVEPYIIAANRQLSRMHPIYRLLHPHFRYTMEINARARQQLINAGGVIESTFSPGKCSMELSSAVYDKLWRFDMEALPADLIRRGMAVEHDAGKLELTIKDYPFANDGLLVWDSIKKWASDYVTHYYPSAEDITGDEELQGWWTEVRTKGHADKKDEPWWPVLDSHESLVHVLTTIMWVTSGHHAAVNFGQYPYAGYFPNRPTIARKNMPVEDGQEEEMEEFWKNPEKVLLDVFPSQLQAVEVMAVLHGLSTHSPDEEYMGKHAEPAWAWEVEPIINAAFEGFCGSMTVIEGTIDERNCNKELRNRCGAGLVPYELLKPFSGPGVTGKGIPNSISI